ncbi:MAG: fused MFS/spermidine synthase [Candidatus Moranbacteria bacterium]|nr:fused MFS/spermidine synthase [Candidatus Moranbacteria bacterium]
MHNKNFFLLLVSFVSGLSIMAMEISASRLLAPHFGTSVFIWTNIIGVVMVALSLGYYFGGKLADRIPKIDFLLKLIFSAGFLFLTIPLIIKPLVSLIDFKNLGLASSSMIIFISSLVFTTILFAVPLFLLGMTSPFIIKLYLADENEKTGSSVGLVSAISTIGSILGTFLPTLYLIPSLGTKATINIFALILIILGIFGFKKNKFNFLILLAVFGIFLFFNNLPIKKQAGLIFEDESAYQYITVKRDNNGTNYLSTNEGLGIQSVYNAKKTLTGYYFDYVNVLPYLINAENPKKVLIIGLCGGTLANQLHHFFPEETIIDGVEIDPVIINAAKKYFAIEDTQTTIFNSDGRMFLKNNSKKYDLMVVDAYSHEFYIPWTLTTKEFWESAKRSLSENGIIAINVNSETPDSQLLKSISNTMASVFPNTYVTPINNGGINYVLTAAKTPIDFENATKLTENQQLKNLSLAYGKNLTKQVAFNENEMILTDDKAPVDFMTDHMVLDYLRR